MPYQPRPMVTTDHLPEHLSPRLRQILASRGVQSAAELQHNTSALLPANLLKGLPEALQVLQGALAKQQRILIIGDFDCDGATSTALMVLALQAMGAQHVDFLVPNRFEFGYGLSVPLVDIAIERQAELIITVDNGISSVAGVAAANAAGITVVITDHHIAGAVLPAAAAIVNPNQPGCPFPSKALAGVGVAFYVLAALHSALQQQGWYESMGIAVPKMADYLDLVALGTVADVVPLDANNRILVHQGLQRLRAGYGRPGIQALMRLAKRQPGRLKASDLGFAIGPRLNAVGRLDDMTLGIHCLLTTSPTEAMALATQMDELNQDRKLIEQSMQHEAARILSQLAIEDNPPAALVLYHPEWHQGVVGLVASQLKERYHRPVFVLAASGNGQLKGSGRSIPGIHLKDMLEHVAARHPEVLGQFGGHAMAAGLSLSESNWRHFQRVFAATVEELADPSVFRRVILTDGILAPEELHLNFVADLEAAGPFGQGFPEPLFEGDFMLLNQRLVGEKHLKLTVAQGSQQWDAIAFNVDLTQWPNPHATCAKLIYQLDRNVWQGKERLQLLVNHLHPLL